MRGRPFKKGKSGNPGHNRRKADIAQIQSSAALVFDRFTDSSFRLSSEVELSR
jgi:hypothetical protein